MDKRRGRRSRRNLVEETDYLSISDLRHDLTYNGRARETFIIQDGPFDGARIWIAWKPLRLGHRPWLECSACRKPVGRLFDTQLLCRACAELDYAAQRDRPHVGQRREDRRLLSRAQALRLRLGQFGGYLGAPLPAKPRGMHLTTFYRLIQELAEIEEQALSVVRARVAPKLARLRSFVTPPA
jgi:hypothetical protein